MRILHLSKFYPPDTGGLEHVVARLAEGAAAAGHEVQVVCAAASSGARQARAAGRPSMLRGVSVARVPTWGVLWSQPIAPAYLRAARWPADVIHLHHPHPLADIAVLGRPVAPLVVTHHSDVRRQLAARPFYGPLVRAVLRRATVIAVPARAHIAVSRELRGFEPKVRVVPFGVDASRFTPAPGGPRPAPPWGAGPGPVGLFVGRLVGYKGLDVLLEAVTGTDLQVVIAGSGPLAPWLEAEVHRLDLQRQVLLAGEVAEADLPAYYRAADYFVLPSTTPAEMFGIVLLEAMACGKPALSTALPTGVREVNVSDQTGLEVPPGDPVALRAAMQRLAGDPALRERLGRAGRKRVEERFTLERMVEAHLALYEEMVGGNGERGEGRGEKG